MRERVAFAGLGEQQRGAAVALQIGGMGGKLRDKDQRRTVDVRRHVDQRGERMTGVAVERRQRSGAGGAQQRLGQRYRREIRRLKRILRRSARHGTGEWRIAGAICVHGTRLGMGSALTKGAQDSDLGPLGLEFATESHSCCKGATFRTRFLGFKTSAADLKFLQSLKQALRGTSNPKPH